jgi:hypothetical protein
VIRRLSQEPTGYHARMEPRAFSLEELEQRLKQTADACGARLEVSQRRDNAWRAGFVNGDCAFDGVVGAATRQHALELLAVFCALEDVAEAQRQER